MHLTNYAINKTSKDFVQPSEGEGEFAHKMSLTETYQILEEMGIDVEQLKKGINEIIIKTQIKGEKLSDGKLHTIDFWWRNDRIQ